ncbi:hypothetical protein J4442_03170 [Candidatus Woesearchaeota archaeon]|nr:hypothetical protein [Candidatus Woesearchaeota archaeon]
MRVEDFAYIVETKKTFDNAVVSVLKAVEQKGWTLFQIYDVKERLATKGFEQKPLKIKAEYDFAVLPRSFSKGSRRSRKRRQRNY